MLNFYKYSTWSLLIGHRFQCFTYIYHVINNSLNKFNTLVLALVIICVSCTERGDNLVDARTNAQEFCTCADKAATLILKMKSSERMDTILYNSVNASIDEMEQCMGEIANVEEKAEALNKLNSEAKEQYERDYYEALNKKCPNVSKAFNSLQSDHVH